ncbi:MULTISPECIES: FAD-binding oxidoreductase [Mycolicibacterium]|uniref:nitric oxide dioxygenase n=2 Tax=Mycolicibacterium gilvum TaxID=1804 RepID=E6TNR3_MYCSR|nr:MULTISPECIES: FAD-binding oxidoreductase [Mycolicibacterium]ADT97230.1 2-polyprenylphenol hydroxylase-like oxidoreductase [Mycolicibacterium gilvum Spyr1]MBV5245250.1 2-polyprenylphenol hydroxylase [Mycolicibacterium sp. PAM1]MCV7055930.1 2-polyprenylphenol hydroxylase [Mycolicibacterium gilvum]STZ41335.1 2-polyprenylphenol 6-hydroxylase [Mycolicibacterium gilvum]
MGLEDRDSVRILREAFEPGPGSERLVGEFYTRWFAADLTARDLFPPDMAGQRQVFAHAMRWLCDELIAQRAEEPVAFLAQLGRDHRKYGVTPEHYAGLQDALLATVRTTLTDRWDARLEEAATDVVTLAVGVMSGAGEAETAPPFCDGTVLEHLRPTRDVSVIRLKMDHHIDYHAGQYVSVQVPQWPRRWRFLSPAIPADPQGYVEFHVRSVAGGMVSTTILGETRPGDRWRLAAPHGAMHVDREAGDVLMVAGSTGLAPLRALIMDMCRFAANPRVHLFFGAKYPCELYDLPTLWEVASMNPWLSVTPVSEFDFDPPWAAEYPDNRPPRGLHVRQTGRLDEVVTRYGSWGDRQILVCGRPEMVAATRSALIAKGAPAERIQHDPLGN